MFTILKSFHFFYFLNNIYFIAHVMPNLLLYKFSMSTTFNVYYFKKFLFLKFLNNIYFMAHVIPNPSL